MTINVGINGMGRIGRMVIRAIIESQNKDISCVDKNNNYCCSHSRSECCQTSSLYAYIVLGSLFMIFMCCFCYTLFVYRYIRVKPDTSQPPSSQTSI